MRVTTTYENLVLECLVRSKESSLLSDIDRNFIINGFHVDQEPAEVAASIVESREFQFVE